MNRRGTTMILGIMIFMMIFITTVIFIEPIKDQIETARSAAGLDCTAAGLSVGVEMTCIAVDWILVIFFLAAMGVAFTFLGRTSIRQGGVQ